MRTNRRKNSKILKEYDGCGVDGFECKGICKQIHEKQCLFKQKMILIKDKRGYKREYSNKSRRFSQ